MCREDYLLQIKNAMLFHFKRKDIRLTLEDINLIFESGLEDGKTEKELCQELGDPKDFARSLLHDNKDNKSTGVLSLYIPCGLILCMFLLLVSNGREPMLLSIPPIILPVCILFFLGGDLSNMIRKNPTRHPKRDAAYCALSSMHIIGQQVSSVLINNSLKIPDAIISTTYCLSMLLIVISSGIFIRAAHLIYKGHLPSFSVLTLSAGSICSSLLYNNYLKRFDAPGAPYVICSLPYAASFIFSVIVFLLHIRKDDK